LTYLSQRGYFFGRNALWDQENFEDALHLVEHSIEISGERTELVDFRCDLLFKLRRPQKLLEATMLLEEISEEKTPWNYLKIADAHIFLGDKEEALRWVEKAVHERGFRKYKAFDRDYYDLIRDDPRFVRLLEEIIKDRGIGRPAKDFTATLIDGSELTLSSLRGRVTLIDFWATWCAPCIKELPNLKELYSEFHSRGFEIVSIGLDEKDRLDMARAFIQENNLPWKVSLSGRGYEDEAASLYNVNGLPSIWLIDGDGILQHQDLHGDELRAAVEQMVKSDDTR
jgi:thiol-disulfide isomerase/thioredoxin